jgi:hypothetical protein
VFRVNQQIPDPAQTGHFSILQIRVKIAIFILEVPNDGE